MFSFHLKFSDCRIAVKFLDGFFKYPPNKNCFKRRWEFKNDTFWCLKLPKTNCLSGCIWENGKCQTLHFERFHRGLNNSINEGVIPLITYLLPLSLAGISFMCIHRALTSPTARDQPGTSQWKCSSCMGRIPAMPCRWGEGLSTPYNQETPVLKPHWNAFQPVQRNRKLYFRAKSAFV